MFANAGIMVGTQLEINEFETPLPCFTNQPPDLCHSVSFVCVWLPTSFSLSLSLSTHRGLFAQLRILYPLGTHLPPNSKHHTKLQASTKFFFYYFEANLFFHWPTIASTFTHLNEWIFKQLWSDNNNDNVDVDVDDVLFDYSTWATVCTGNNLNEWWVQKGMKGQICKGKFN